jgi:hypothetical protein
VDEARDAGVADAEAEECGTKTDGMLSSTKPSMEGLYPVLIVMCVHCIVSQEHQIPVEYNAAPNV